jgi:hypothetical protein
VEEVARMRIRVRWDGKRKEYKVETKASKGEKWNRWGFYPNKKEASTARKGLVVYFKAREVRLAYMRQGAYAPR